MPIAPLLYWGITSADGKSYQFHGLTLPLAKGLEPRPPGVRERFWVMRQRRYRFYLFPITVQVAVPFDVAGSNPRPV
jgi:hypothetical protein